MISSDKEADVIERFDTIEAVRLTDVNRIARLKAICVDASRINAEKKGIEKHNLEICVGMSKLLADMKKPEQMLIVKFHSKRVSFIYIAAAYLSGSSEQTNADIVATYGQLVAEVDNIPLSYLSKLKKTVKDLKVSLVW
jgi:hypothetical protein